MWSILLAAAALSTAPGPAPALGSEDAARRQAEAHPELGRVSWFEGSYAEALAAAKEAGKPLLVEFWLEGCPWCGRLGREALSEPAIARRLADYVCLNVDLTADDEGVLRSQEAALLGNRFNVRRFPTVVVVRSEDDRGEDVISGYLPPKAFGEELDRIAAARGTASDFEARVAADPDDLELRYQLSQVYDRLGDYARSNTQWSFIEKADPEGHSYPMRLLAINNMREEMFGCMRGALPVDPNPMLAFLAEERHPDLLHEGWAILGAVYRHLEDAPKAVEAHRNSWRSVPEGKRDSSGNRLAWDLWLLREAISAEDRRFALDVSLAATEALGEANGDELLRAAYLDTLACCYFMNGKRSKAVAVMQRCMKLAPNEPAYRARLDQFQSGEI